MLTLKIFSIIAITLALFFYSFGIWAERFARYLRSWHVVLFWIGFAFDVTGTIMMHFLSEGSFDITESHTLTGQLAIWLMLIHAVWATIVVRENKALLREKFHRYSLLVWMVWLIPYFGGMLMAMNK